MNERGRHQDKRMSAESKIKFKKEIIDDDKDPELRKLVSAVGLAKDPQLNPKEYSRSYITKCLGDVGVKFVRPKKVIWMADIKR